MSQQGQRPPGPPRAPRSAEELEAALLEQVGFLERSAAFFDGGQKSEAKRLAGPIRLLVHSGRSAIPLLGQLGLLDTIAFVDAADEPIEGNVLSMTGLTGVRMSAQSAEYLPKCAMFDSPRHKMVTFERWWTRPVIIDRRPRNFNRRDLVLTMADQDGGVHFDPTLDGAYSDLTRNNSAGWLIMRGPESEPLMGIEGASMRQVAWEMLETLKRRVPIDTIRAPASAPTRNDPCPCGSGKKFKKCHGFGGDPWQ